MDKLDLQTYLRNAASGGTLLTPKHDPNSLGTLYSGYRSVLTSALANQLDAFLQSGDYTATLYSNPSYPSNPDYVVLVPRSGSSYSVPGSGVPAQSPNPTHPLDCLVAVSGQQQGWHIYCDNLSGIASREATGKLIRLHDLT